MSSDEFADFHQSYLSPYVCVHEDKFDENTLMIEYAELGYNDIIGDLSLDLLTGVKKEDFW